MAVRFDGLIILLLFFVNFVTPNSFTSFPKDDESLLDRGPRESLNETGRYLYTHPITNKGNLLCKKCSDKALQDDTYSFHQQPACINKNYNRSGSDQTAPYCNKGEDLGCGQVPFNHTNSHWECNTGYSDTIHTVYSTCRLICNISQTTIGKIYCSEALNWYVDLMPEEQCGVDIAEEKTNVLPLVLGPCGGILLLFIILLVVWCYYKKSRKPSRPSTPITTDDMIPTPPKEIKRKNTSSTIGSCSIHAASADEEEAKQPLMGSNNNNNHSKPQKITTSTSMPSLGQVHNGHLDSGPSSSDVNTSTFTQTDEVMYPCEGAEARSIHTSKGSNRSTESQASSQRVISSDIDEPTLKIFCDKPSESRLTSGLNNMRLQDNYYSTSEGSNVYFAINTDVDSLKIVRKDGGPDFRGGNFFPNSHRMMVLQCVVQEDAGCYKCTMTLRGRVYDNVFSLFVGRQVSNSPTVEENMERAPNNAQAEGIIQQPTVVQGDDGPDHHGNNTPGQHRVNSERLPPEGAENDNRKVSVIPFNGARPKIPRVQVNLLSGGSGVGDKDSPQVKSLRDSTLTNNLDKAKEDSENNLNQFESPRNISENVQNIFSLESNADVPSEHIGSERNLNPDTFLSGTESSVISNTNDLNGADNPLSSDSTNMEPALDIDSLFSSKDALSRDDNPSAMIDEGTTQSTTDNRSESTEFPTNITKNLKEKSLDFSTLLNSENNSDESNNVNGDQHNFESEADTLSRSVSHLDPGTIDRESFRPTPSGRSDDIGIVEAHSDREQQTDVKILYNNIDVRGERSLDTSPIQPLAHVRLETNVRREQGTSHAGNVEDLSMVPRPHGDRLDEPIGDMNEMNEGGAMGGEGMVPGYGQRPQILTKGIDDRFNCKTPLQDLSDCKCIEELCHRANPRKLHGDKKSWFGLGLCYELETHFLYALEYAKSGEVNHGPMYHLMKFALPQSFTIGHVVWYFTQGDSYNKEIVDLLIDRCKNHVNCDYCKRLRRNS